MIAAPSNRLSDLPLWRLLVMLADAERVAGPESESARLLAREVLLRLRTAHQQDAEGEGAGE